MGRSPSSIFPPLGDDPHATGSRVDFLDHRGAAKGQPDGTDLQCDGALKGGLVDGPGQLRAGQARRHERYIQQQKPGPLHGNRQFQCILDNHSAN